MAILAAAYVSGAFGRKSGGRDMSAVRKAVLGAKSEQMTAPPKSRPPTLEELPGLCAYAGLPAADCTLLVKGDITNLSKDALGLICAYYKVPGCDQIASAVIDWLMKPYPWKGAERFNNALNGKPKRAEHVKCMTMSNGVTQTCIDTIGEYENGCVPFASCASGFAKCKPGTIDMDKKAGRIRNGKLHTGCPYWIK